MSKRARPKGSECVSIVICCHTMQRWDDIVEAIASLRRQTRLPDEINLIVDHNEALLARAKVELTDVQVVMNHGRGLSAGRNTGLKISRGDLIGFLDDDAVADPDWLEKLVSACQPSEVLGATGQIAPRWVGERPDWFPDEFLWTVGCTFKGLPSQDNRIRNVLGASMLIPRRVFDVAGGFAANLGRIGGTLVSCEETEFCIRAQAMCPGGYFVFVPEAKIEHKVPAARLTWGYYRARCFAEGQSKAFLASLAARGSLGVEQEYVRKALLGGFLRGIGSLRPAGVKRAAAIAYGLGTTVFGYGRGKIRPPVPAVVPKPTVSAI